MRLYIDIDSLRVIASPGVRAATELVDFKRGDSRRVEIAFQSGLSRVTLEDGATGILGFKKLGEYDGEYLAVDTAWVKETEAAGDFYVFAPNFNGTDLSDALGSGNGDVSDDLVSIETTMEISWDESGKISSSQNVIGRIFNDVIKGNEGTPQALPDADAWLADRSPPVIMRIAGLGSPIGEALLVTGDLSDENGDPLTFPSMQLATFQNGKVSYSDLVGENLVYWNGIEWEIMGVLQARFVSSEDVATPELVTTWVPSNPSGDKPWASGTPMLSLTASKVEATAVGHLCRVGDDVPYTWYRAQEINTTIWELIGVGGGAYPTDPEFNSVSVDQDITIRRTGVPFGKILTAFDESGAPYLGIGHVQADGTYVVGDGAIALQPGAAELLGSVARVGSLSVGREQVVRVDSAGVLFGVDPPVPGWELNDTDSGDYDLGAGDTQQPWVQISGLSVPISATEVTEIGDRVDFSVVLRVVNRSGIRSGTIDVGIGVNGSPPSATGINAAVAAGLDSSIAVGITTYTEALDNGDILAVWVRIQSGSHALFAPDLEGSSSLLEMHVSGGGSGSAAADILRYVAPQTPAPVDGTSAPMEFEIDVALGVNSYLGSLSADFQINYLLNTGNGQTGAIHFKNAAGYTLTCPYFTFISGDLADVAEMDPAEVAILSWQRSFTSSDIYAWLEISPIH